MLIAYSGHFMQEGFEEAGCEIIPLRLNATNTLNELVEQTGLQPDVVFIEFFGKTELPKELFNCKYKTAAYYIDSPLNEYWLAPLANLFDLVYVDQLPSEIKFRKKGINARWLPLFASKTDFRCSQNKKYLITFVGRMTHYRIKRTNLINHIRKHFPINTLQDISRSSMIDAFASSQIVLNENFFPGLNLRFFQGLASGSLLLTERHGQGVNIHFQEDRHYVGYSPNDILTTIKNIAKSYHRFEHIALCGQEECALKHAAVHRALTVIEDIGRSQHRHYLSVANKKMHEAQSKYCHALRFGGNIDEPVRLLKDSLETSASTASHALCILGSIDMRRNRHESGIIYLEKSASFLTTFGLNATLKLMLIFAEDKKLFQYTLKLLTILQKLKFSLQKYSKDIKALSSGKDVYYNICMLGYKLFFDLHLEFDLGFNKLQIERYPDYAMEYAILAFETKPSPDSLEAIIKCTDSIGVAPEALEYIKKAILIGAASNEQIALSVSLARTYYDFSYAESTANALKKCLSLPKE